MSEGEARRILGHIVEKVKNYSQDCVVILHISPIEEGYIGSFQFDLGDWKDIGYSGPIYIVDKETGMYYMISADYNIDYMNKYIIKGRNNYFFRLKNKIINIFYRYTNF